MGQGRHTLRSISDPVYPDVLRGDVHSTSQCRGGLWIQQLYSRLGLSRNDDDNESSIYLFVVAHRSPSRASQCLTILALRLTPRRLTQLGLHLPATPFSAAVTSPGDCGDIKGPRTTLRRV